MADIDLESIKNKTLKQVNKETIIGYLQWQFWCITFSIFAIYVFEITTLKLFLLSWLGIIIIPLFLIALPLGIASSLTGGPNIIKKFLLRNKFLFMTEEEFTKSDYRGIYDSK